MRRKSAIDDDFNKVGIHPNDPNEDVVKKINEQRDLLNQGVLGAWAVLYKEENEKNPFPAVKVLGEDFKRQFEDLRFRPKEELARPYRERYQTKIQTYLPELKDLIDVRHPKGKKRMAGSGEHAADQIPPRRTRREVWPEGAWRAAAGEETEWVGIVDWKDDRLQQFGRAFRLARSALDAGRRAGAGRSLGVRVAAAGNQERE